MWPACEEEETGEAREDDGYSLTTSFPGTQEHSGETCECV